MIGNVKIVRSGYDPAKGRQVRDAALDQQERVAKVNELIRVIASHGRKFFAHGENVTRFEIDARGRVWLTDHYSGKRIYTHYEGRWRGFTNGGTLKFLCVAFRDFITRGVPVPSHHFGPWPQWMCEGDPWAYGDDILPVREAASRLGITTAQPSSSAVSAVSVSVDENNQ